MQDLGDFENFRVDLKKYEIDTCISSDGFSSVYLVTEKGTNKQFAAISLKPISNSEDNQKLTLTILTRVSAPTILRFHGYSQVDFSGDDAFTIITDYAPHGSLSKVITDESHGRRPDEYDDTQKQIILCGIAHGMMLLHSHGIFHGNLKPENVLLDEKYNPLITDFAIAQVVDPSNPRSLTGLRGTPLYMAPEIPSKSDYGLEADVYSFGILMFEVITGERVFDYIRKRKLNRNEFLSEVVNGLRPAFNCPMKSILKSLIEQCWHPDPNQRPTFQEIFNVLSLSNVQENHEDPDPTDPSIACLDDVDIYRFLDYVTEITSSNS